MHDHYVWRHGSLTQYLRVHWLTISWFTDSLSHGSQTHYLMVHWLTISWFTNSLSHGSLTHYLLVHWLTISWFTDSLSRGSLTHYLMVHWLAISWFTDSQSLYHVWILTNIPGHWRWNSYSVWTAGQSHRFYWQWWQRSCEPFGNLEVLVEAQGQENFPVTIGID